MHFAQFRNDFLENLYLQRSCNPNRTLDVLDSFKKLKKIDCSQRNAYPTLMNTN